MSVDTSPLGPRDIQEEVTWFSGLDLGQSKDFTAFVTLECRRMREQPVVPHHVVGPRFDKKGYPILHPPPPPRPPYDPTRRYAIRGIERFDLGTSYPKIIDWVVARFATSPLLHTTLAIDQTGVGRAVVDMFKKARPQARLRPITITGGTQVLLEGSGFKVPKKELVSICQVLLQSRRLSAAARIPHVNTLLRELENFKVKINANANETFEAWREKDHDDLVLALSLAAWLAERGRREFWVRV